MSEIARVEGHPLGWDATLGTAGMRLFIATEAFLFVVLFFAYFYLGNEAPVWPPEPPRLVQALVMLAVLLASSGILWSGERALARGRPGLARAGTWGALLLGIVFLVLQGFEYAHRLETVRPSSDAYGSIFYVITGFHGAHVALGIFLLAFAALLPELGPRERPPHKPLGNVSLYWHFVDAVWIVIVALLYALPKLGGGAT